ncbi:MAG: hypothetical protein AAGA67_09580 [Cyanobacteria bacterium P01_F01_bin.153]
MPGALGNAIHDCIDFSAMGWGGNSFTTPALRSPKAVLGKVTTPIQMAFKAP